MLLHLPVHKYMHTFAVCVQALARKRKAHPTAALPHLPSQAAAAAVQRILGTLARDQSGEPGALQAAVVMARQLSAALGVL